MSSPSTRTGRQDLRPKKSLAQYFLKDPQYLDAMVEAAAITAADRVLEIGPGTGALTQALADTGAQIVAVELDERMVEHLSQTFADRPNVAIVQGDILELDPAALMAERTGHSGGYVVAANLPYYITSAILRRLLEAATPPERAAVMVQKEVAERICAEPNNMSLLAVSVQFYARPELVKIVPAGAFYPKPKVDSAILRLDVFDQPVVQDVDAESFFTVVRAGFGQRRKQVANSLSANLGLAKQTVRDALSAGGIDPARRAETFSLEEWRAVCLALGRS